jgi:rubrerythrin
MPIVFSGDELINIAIDIERRGISFYDVMAKSTDNEMARAVFEGLVVMEREHLKTFQDMLSEFGKQQPQETSPTELPDYIKTLIDEAVFSDDLITGEIAMQADSDIKAIELGISAEKDSLLFYYEMKENMPQRTIPVLNRIIAEEKSHLQQLSEIKKRLSGSGE